jgi:hypothetical protein
MVKDKRKIAAAMAMLLLSACSTAIDTRIAMPSDMKGRVNITKVDADSSTGVDPTVVTRLQEGVQTRLASYGGGDKPVEVMLAVNSFNVVSGSSRAFLGAFAGSNSMDVLVTVMGTDGTKMAEYGVKRESNPGGYGMFYDQEQATIDTTADGIVQAIRGEH